MKKIFKEAHKMTREMVKEYGVDYQVQFGLCLSYLLENKEEDKMNENIERVKDLLESVTCTEEQKETTLTKFEKYNSKDAELANKLAINDNNIRKYLKNAGLYAYEYGVEKKFLGEGKFETRNINLWQNYGKARIYFDLYIDNILVQQNVYIVIK